MKAATDDVPHALAPPPGVNPHVWVTLSDFRRRVYARLREVPPGHVTTYGALARAVGCRSARAIGQALCRNPAAPQVPCHRVIASDLSIGGFAGSRAGRALQRKRALLRQEGVEFDDGTRLLDAGRLWEFRADTVP